LIAVIHDHPLQHLLGSKAETRRALALIEDDKDGFEEDIPKDCEADAGVALDTAEAGRSAVVCRSVIDISLKCVVSSALAASITISAYTWHSKDFAPNGNMEVRQLGAAAVGVATL
jgi:hypothetical protein